MKSTDHHEHTGNWVEEAVREHEASLLRYATRLVGDPERARDVVQDTFVRLLKQPPERVNGHVVEWLFTVCRNRSLDVIRKESRMSHFADGEVETVRAREPRPGHQLEATEKRDAVLAMVDRLPPNQQEVIRLKFQSGFSYKEISRITELSVSNVGFLIHTAVKRLRQEMAAQQP
ncbi:RNA polymerase sigma factor [Synoicihabitans lomoniglobus]|uniref:Sigma-70 family RNA polymerase sigma factor n=1 Tax=Synoicihabitans lomoniglobus TaxID=2909285 RepID=A0AAF0CNR9_9BACT|nr:sigma-70 family RNA polymerase sigma factor [Opitutaceae bacterium LMO-M01]WED64760.1 sigma-70 family RNA polymerase sigma factor [Opitutaceae bacterium LMO-M01]